MFTGAAFLRYLDEGAYLVTPGWLADWPRQIERWGGDCASLRQLFAESVSRLILLDTGVDPESAKHLGDLAEVLGRPTAVVPVGLDFFRLFLSKEVLQWRLERRQPRSANADTGRARADYAMALDLLGQLPRMEDEEVIVDRIFELFHMLFAPGRVHYLSIVEGHPGRLRSLPPAPDEAVVRHRLQAGLEAESAPTESGRGLRIKIGSGKRAVAIVEMEDVAEPGYVRQYLNLGLAIAGVIALAVENSRAFSEVQQSRREQARLIVELRKAVAEVQTLSDLLPVCANCRRVRDDQGYWKDVEAYLEAKTGVTLTHGVCPECWKTLYPGYPLPVVKTGPSSPSDGA